MVLTPALADRAHLYRQIARHNRVVGLLRLAVPLIGLVAGTAFLGYFALSNFSDGIGFEALTLDGGRLVVNKPRYSGVLSDGGTYRVNAETAVGRDGAFSLIDLTALDGLIERPDREPVLVGAKAGTLDSTAQTLTVPGRLDVTEVGGTVSQFTQAQLFFGDNSLVSKGAVRIEFADGKTLDAARGTYDGRKRVWVFEAARLVLPDGAPGTSEARQ